MKRRMLLAGALAGLPGCKLLDGAETAPIGRLMASANSLTYRMHRALGGGRTLAQEFTPADIRQGMHPNGSTDPQSPAYLALKARGFADWRLTVTGLVDRSLSLSLADLKAMPTRRQITRHDCVEGWSCIAEWIGVPLGHVLGLAGLRPAARFIVFRCMDDIERSLSGPVFYHESIDLVDAFHPQTLLAWGMNGGDLPVRNGAPLRLRVERQLGYKMAKYLGSIEVVAALDGRGSYWAERGYDWYAGI